jgi:hypothetical protein
MIRHKSSYFTQGNSSSNISIRIFSSLFFLSKLYFVSSQFRTEFLVYVIEFSIHLGITRTFSQFLFSAKKGDSSHSSFSASIIKFFHSFLQATVVLQSLSTVHQSLSVLIKYFLKSSQVKYSITQFETNTISSVSLISSVPFFKYATSLFLNLFKSSMFVLLYVSGMFKFWS